MLTVHVIQGLEQSLQGPLGASLSFSSIPALATHLHSLLIRVLVLPTLKTLDLENALIPRTLNFFLTSSVEMSSPRFLLPADFS